MADCPISINKAIAVLDLVKYWLFDPKPNCVLNLGIQCNGINTLIIFFYII